MIDRAEWQKIRDAAGVPKGYTKASMGDLLDKWHSLMFTDGKTPKVIQKGIRLVRKKIKALAQAGAADMKAHAIKLYTAAAEYEEKFVKANNLAVVPAQDIVHKTAKSIPYHDYTTGSYGTDGQKTPQKHLVATLSEIRQQAFRTVIRRFKGENELVKVCPAAKHHVDYFKAEYDDNDPLPTREEWQAHRDGAGIPQGWVEGASIGETLAAFRTALGDLSKGLPNAWENLAPGAEKAAATAAVNLHMAAISYLAKLKKEKKDTGKGQNVADDLSAMSKAAFQTVVELDATDQLLAATKKLVGL
jgi:hypothetical protein